MKRSVINLIVLIFCISSFAFLGYASPSTNNENARTEEEQTGGTTVEKGKFEFSIATYLNIDRIKTKYDGEEFDPYTITTLSVPVRLGYFLTNNIELEPEIVHTYVKYSEEDYSYSQTSSLLLANVAYNFKTASKVMPFVIGGAGLARVSYDETGEEGESHSSFAWNAGGGIKWFATNSVALRIEYRFMHFAFKEDIDTIYKITEGHTYHRIFFGFSVFF